VKSHAHIALKNIILLQALHMFERLEDDHGISICYENLGDTYMQMGEIRQVMKPPPFSPPLRNL
jgi:hypothetical protein